MIFKALTLTGICAAVLIGAGSPRRHPLLPRCGLSHHPSS